MQEDGEALATVRRCKDVAGVIVMGQTDVIRDIYALDDKTSNIGYPGVKHNNPSNNRRMNIPQSIVWNQDDN